jgi:hypothetical protein
MNSSVISHSNGSGPLLGAAIFGLLILARSVILAVRDVASERIGVLR